jgi:hypothetical protein
MWRDRHARGRRRRWLSLVAVTGGLVVSACGSSHSSSSTTSSTATSPSAGRPAAANNPSGDLSNNSQQIVTLLHHYEGSYSAHDLDALRLILAPNVRRFGAGSGGCVHSNGETEVLADYAAQFAAGSGAYRLVGVRPAAIHFTSPSNATITLAYHIAPVSQGQVTFQLTEGAQGWQISDINATCQGPATGATTTTAATSTTS